MINMKKNILLAPLFMMFLLSACNPSLSIDSGTTSEEEPASSQSEDQTSDSEGSQKSDSKDDQSSSSSEEQQSDSEGGQSSSSEEEPPEEDVITLKWGESTDFSDDIEGIKYGENVRAGAVSLVATSNYEGVFTITLSNSSTVAKNESDAKLIDYLVINVYEGNVSLSPDKSLPSGTIKTTISKDTDKTQSFNVVGTPTGVDFTIFVSLSSDAILKQSEIKYDTANLEVDWGKA